MTITEPTDRAQSAAALKKQLAEASAAKSELTARENALRIQIGWLESTPAEGASTLITGPRASGKTTVLRSLVADAASQGHRVITINGMGTRAAIIRHIATELVRVEAELSVHIVVADDVSDIDWLIEAVLAGASQHKSALIYIVMAAETVGADERDYFDRIITLSRS